MTAHPENKTKVKVIDSLWTFAIAVATVGPFALPLLWRNPRYSLLTKQVLSVIVIVLTVWLVWYTKNQVTSAMKSLETLKNMQQGY